MGVSVSVVADAAPQAVYQHGPQAIYDPTSNRTYIAYLGLDRDLFVTYYDHQAGTLATVVKAGTRASTMDTDDAHGAPSVAVDNDGHIHIVWRSHGGVVSYASHQHLKSDNPHDISAWTSTDLGTGTYPLLVNEPTTGNLYVFDRAGTGHGSTFPTHEYGSVRKSTDGGSTWSSATAIIDTTGTTESLSDAYITDAKVANDGRIHLAWVVARGTTHDEDRQDVFHAIYDPADDELYAADGTSLGSTINWTEHTSECRVFTGPAYIVSMALDGQRVIIAHGSRFEATDDTVKVTIWDGLSWTTTDTGITQDKDGPPFTALFFHKGRLTLVAPKKGDGVDDLVAYQLRSSWMMVGTLRSGTTGEGFGHCALVAGDGPFSVLAIEAPSGYARTDATSSNLLDLYLLGGLPGMSLSLSSVLARLTGRISSQQLRDVTTALHPETLGVWTTYSPTWSASSAPSIGNGTIDAKYWSYGDLVVAKAKITMGSTTSYGSGAYSLTTPSTMADGTTGLILGTWFLFENGGTVREGGEVVAETTGSVLFRQNDGAQWWIAGLPLSMSSGDVFSCVYQYEAA